MDKIICMRKSIFNTFSLAAAPNMAVFITSEILFFCTLYFGIVLPFGIKYTSDTMVNVKMKTTFLF